MTPDEIKAKTAKLHKEYSAMSDDDIRAEIIQWKPETIERHVGNRILEERDPTKKLLIDLSNRVASIEFASTKHEFKTWAFWLALLGVLLSLVAILLAGAMLLVMLRTS